MIDKQIIADAQKWRRHIHAHPETAFEEFNTSEFITDKLKSFNLDDVQTGLATTGIVASLKGNIPSDKSIALRADIDALNLHEKNDFDHKSKNKGKMHACGHDGHTAMLLAAARHLSENRDFAGTVYFIFQPAEENEGGARVMVEEGLFDTFPAERVYGMHNWPGLPAGTFALRQGPIMAAADRFDLIVKGKGGHAAMPHLSHDPIACSSQLVSALQNIHSRRMNPLDQAVLSITQIHAGDAYNVIPDEVVLKGSLRSFKENVRDDFIREIEHTAAGICAANHCTYEFIFRQGYPPTVNEAQATEIAAEAARATVGENKVDLNAEPSMGSEDFSFMLKEKPGCYLFLGNGPGEGGCMLHNPHYDFNDNILSTGASYWVNLVKQELK